MLWDNPVRSFESVDESYSGPKEGILGATIGVTHPTSSEPQHLEASAGRLSAKLDLLNGAACRATFAAAGEERLIPQTEYVAHEVDSISSAIIVSCGLMYRS